MRLKIFAAVVALWLPTSVWAYAIFTHQELIDLVWDDSIQPLLLQHYPGLTKQQLDQAHAYAYGGSIIQDMGYYPLGHRFFSDLTHYVRSGDFVAALFHTASNANELAFAIGALSHYVGDNIGHSEAVNPATGTTFPKLIHKYGPIVTYEEAPIDHVRVEFGFDTAQIALHRFTPEQFRRRIGFRVAEAALNRALKETYGLSLRDTLGPVRPRAESYRISVHRVMPLIAAAQVIRIDGRLPAERNDEALRDYLRAVAQLAESQNRAAMKYSPGAPAHVLATLFRIFPKIGPFRVLDIKAPSARTEDLYIRSLNHSRSILASYLKQYGTAPYEVLLADRDLDTGNPVAPGRYGLTDKTYAKLLDRVSRPNSIPMPLDLVRHIFAYYSDPAAPIKTKRHPEAWKQVTRDLQILKERYPEMASR